MQYNKLLAVFFIVLPLSGCFSGNTTKNSETPQAIQSTATGTLVIRPIIFDKDTFVRDAVRNECRLPEKTAEFTQQYANNQYENILINNTTSPANAQILSMSIDNLSGSQGGAWSGGKMLSIKGVLKQNGKVLGNFKARRVSGGGFMGAYKGTCAILGRCTKTLGKDVAAWLQHPSKNAVLGDY